jgi:putative phage-type endonuclease
MGLEKRMVTATPTGVHVGTFTPGSPAWHAARANGVGGSEVAPILGLSPFESRFSLWHRKKGTIPPLDLKDEMEWGIRLEPTIAQKYADAHPDLTVVDCGTYRHKDRPWQIANPDRFTLDKGGRLVKPVEIKYSLYGDGFGEPGSDQIPHHYWTQAQWYLDTLGLDEIDVAVFIGASATYAEYTIKADPADQAFYREQVKDFLDDLGTGTLPNLDGHEATYQAVKELHPEIDGSTAELPDALAEDYLDAIHAKKDAAENARLASARVAQHIGGAQYATWRGTRLASRRAKKGGTPYLQAERNLDAIELPAA